MYVYRQIFYIFFFYGFKRGGGGGTGRVCPPPLNPPRTYEMSLVRITIRRSYDTEFKDDLFGKKRCSNCFHDA